MFLFSALALFNFSFAQSGRIEKDFSNNDWKLWLDIAAQWKNDVLYAPPVNIKQLPYNSPTIGWDALEKMSARTIHLPATVEEFFWGLNGNVFGVSGNYLGASWFVTKITCRQNREANEKVKRFT